MCHDTAVLHHSLTAHAEIGGTAIRMWYHFLPLISTNILLAAFPVSGRKDVRAESLQNEGYFLPILSKYYLSPTDALVVRTGTLNKVVYASSLKG